MRTQRRPADEEWVLHDDKYKGSRIQRGEEQGSETGSERKMV